MCEGRLPIFEEKVREEGERKGRHQETGAG